MKFTKKRSQWTSLLVGVVLGIVGILVVAKAMKTMFVEQDFWLKVQKRLIVEGRPVHAKRGNILSDEGLILAASVPQYKMFLDFVVTDKNPKRQAKDQRLRDSLFNAHVDSLAIGLAQIFPDIKPNEQAAFLREGHRQKSRHWPLYNRRINYEQYQAVRKLPYFQLGIGRMGLHQEEYSTRTNPYGRLARRTIGALYEGKDAARMGLELGLDSILRGKDGEQRLEKVRSSRLPTITKPAVDGYDVRTTLNVQMQDVVEKMLSDQVKAVEAEYGICILMEVKTGDVKAISTIQRGADGSVFEGPNYAVSQLMEPGSVFKPISFLVALNDGKISVSDAYDVNGGQRMLYGRRMRDANYASGGDRVLTVPQMLQKSSNVGVSSLIDRAYRDNTKAFADGVRRTGVTDNFHLPIPGATTPRIPSLSPERGVGHNVDLCWMSIGYVTQVPPIHTLAFYNGIANNGRMVRPRFYTAKMKDGEVIEEYPVIAVREQMAKPQAVKDMQMMLTSVVVQGLGKKARPRNSSAAGKTGTAQVWTKAGRTAEYLVSFAGYFPAEQPEYSMIVCLRKPGPASGGGMCAPVFRKVAESVLALRKNTNYGQAKDSINTLLPIVSSGNLVQSSNLLNLLRIPHDNNAVPQGVGLLWGRSQTSRTALQFHAEQADKSVVPNVVGYGLRDAVYRLELMGLRVKYRGIGLVTAQSLQPGYKFRRGETVMLTLGHPRIKIADSIATRRPAPSVPPKSAPPARETAATKPAATTKPAARPAAATAAPKPAAPKETPKKKEAAKTAVPAEKTKPKEAKKKN